MRPNYIDQTGFLQLFFLDSVFSELSYVLKIVIDVLMYKEVAFKHTLVIIIFWGNVGPTLLDFIINFGGVAILLIVEVLGKSIISIIKLIMFKLTLKE